MPEQAAKIDFFFTFSAFPLYLSYIFIAFPEKEVYNTLK